MISWIQHHLIRHGRWIFLSLLVVIIVAFVFTIGNTPGCTTDRSNYQAREFYGYDLNSQLEMRPLYQKTSVSVLLNSGREARPEQLQSQVLSRIALLAIADEIGIPGPDEDTLRGYIQTKGAFRGADGQFSPDAYTSFVDNMETNPDIPDGLVILTLEEDYRMDQVSNILGGPGYLLPSEAIAQTQRNETTFTLKTASFDFQNFTPEEPTEKALQEYFENNKERYEISERVQANYIFFPSSQYLNTVEAPTEADLRDHFISNRARFVADFNANKSEPEETEENDSEITEPTVSFEDVRNAVTAELNNDLARRAANIAAQEFAKTLYNQEVQKDSEEFSNLLSEKGLSLIEIKPYTADETNISGLSSDMLEAGFTLGARRYYSDPYPINDGFGVMIYEGRIAPEIPPFDTVSSQVAIDYKADEKRRLFNERGLELKSTLEEKLSEGTDFTEAAEELELAVNTYEPFKSADAPRELPRAAMQAAQGMAAGELSPMLNDAGKGIYVYVEEKNVPEISEDNESFTQAQDFLKRYSAFISSSALLNELITRGMPEDDSRSEEEAN